MTILDAIAPDSIKETLPPGYFALRRAGALHFLGEEDLALIELEEALRVKSNAPDLDHPARATSVISR